MRQMGPLIEGDFKVPPVITNNEAIKKSYREILNRSLNHALAYLDALDQTSVAASTSKKDVRARLSRGLSDFGVKPADIIDDLVADMSGGLLGSTGGRFFGWVIGGALPSALAADWLTSAWDQNGALHATAPAGALIEEVCGDWLKELLGLPDHASFAFVSGSQMAHVTGLAAARNALLSKKGWDVERKGINGSPPIRVLTTAQRHGSIDRALRLLGMGSDSIVALAANYHGCLEPDALEAAFEDQEEIPTIVHLQAGDINTGAFDAFDKIIPIAHRHGAWVHVDGAIGLWVNASPKHRHLVSGIEQADSWTTDGHKWLNVPYDSGYAFVAHPEAHRNSMSHRASYLTHASDARDPMDWNPEWSRRCRGIATYAAIRELGRSGLADLIDRTCSLAHSLVTRIGALDGAEMVYEPQINQGLVRFLSPGESATDKEHDRYTDEVMTRILESGEAFFGGTTWNDMRCMRVSVCNWRTTTQDVDRAVLAVQKALKEP